MKHRIKIGVSMILTFVFVHFAMNGINTPVQLAARVESVLYSNQYIANMLRNFQSKSLQIATEPIIRQTEAKEERTVWYKGRAIKILADDDSEVSEEILEFLYQMELKKELTTPKGQ
jgi:hypothetical protein